MTRCDRQVKWLAASTLALAMASVSAAEITMSDWQDTQGRGAAAATSPSSSTGHAVLYEFPNFGGATVAIDQAGANDLDWANFGNFRNRATSIRIESGTWMVCSEIALRGDCRILGPGEYPQLPAPLAAGISSARRV
jgi:hypothetical protein